MAFLFLTLPRVYAEDPDFGDRQNFGLIEYGPMDEASGIAASRQNANVLWSHNDSGDQNRIYAFNSQGRHLGVYRIAGVAARDWEDIAVGPGPVDGWQYIYVGEIGDNSAQHDLKFIYRIPEPPVNSSQVPVDTSISGAETMTFQYPDGNRDAETLMVDPLTRDIFVVSKRESNVNVYRAGYPQSTTQTVTLDQVATLNLTLAVGGDISHSGLEILIKTYDTIFYWCRTPEQTLWQAFENAPVSVPYLPEIQGEAVAWAADGMGYYTVSEETVGIPAHLYFYPRANPTSVISRQDTPSSFALEQNYPNPFNPSTQIGYTIPWPVSVNISVFNLLGQEIRRLVHTRQPAGVYSIFWDGKNEARQTVPGGYYIYRIRAGNFVKAHTMILLK
jgi:hypothetical protein